MKKFKTLVAILLLTILSLSTYANDRKSKDTPKPTKETKKLYTITATINTTHYNGNITGFSTNCYTISFQMSSSGVVYGVTYSSTPGACGGNAPVFHTTIGHEYRTSVEEEALVKDVICQTQNPAQETQCVFE